MCGIVGVVSAAPIDPREVERLRDRLAHRGPDHAGIWLSADARICLGHRRLAIIDLDARANQPMVSRDARFAITYNGEIYNHQALRRELQRDGAAFRTESDTETLIEAYRRWGTGCLDRLSGMFAFALWDAQERRLFCARDRAGEKPFYWAQCGDAFLFASEPKALHDWPGLSRRVDHDALIDFLSLGYVADPKSIWRDLRKLAPAHSLAVELDERSRPTVGEPRRYWSLVFGKNRGKAVCAERIRATLLAAADEMSIADVPLGVFLSGGVDSSSVTAALSLSGHAVRSFTIGFDEPDYDERAWARQVAERYGTEHVERTVAANDLPVLKELLDHHFDEPFGDYSSLPTYVLCREARGAITVALSGDGADELFAGYRKYQRLARRAELAGVLPMGVARALASAADAVLPEGSHWRRTLGQYGLDVAPMLADMLCVGAPTALLRRIARGELARALAHYSPLHLVEQVLAGAPADAGLIDTMRHVDFALTLPGDMLVKVDRASMAVALEVRPLFLQRDVMELAASIPGEDLADRSAAKLALKDAVRPWLPDALLDRRKQGFALPLPHWLRGGDSAEGRGADVSNALANWIDVDAVRRMARSHASGAADFTQLLYSCSVLDRWVARWQPA